MLKRRGFDVTAIANPLYNKDARRDLGLLTANAEKMKDKVYNSASSFFIKKDIDIKRFVPEKAIDEELLNGLQSGQRGIISWGWAGRNVGHTINVERTSDGLKYVDAQIGQTADSWKGLKYPIRVGRYRIGGRMLSSFRWYRSDDKDFDERLLDLLVKGNEGQK
ncbi:MAG: toxin glutamine deamidase domain-containing protein [Lactobacillus iners]|nr:toxin glutamine deamidase domain-containing protein [Lactobacillus iners]